MADIVIFFENLYTVMNWLQREIFKSLVAGERRGGGDLCTFTHKRTELVLLF